MKNKRDKILILTGAVLMQVSIGAVYSWSLFNEALHDKFHWDINDIILTYSLIIFIFAFTTMISGRLLDKFGPGLIATVGSILYGGGVILTGFADSLHELYIYYGIIAGIGIGFVYVCPLATAMKWFPGKKGMVTGIVVGAFGLGSLVFKTLIQKSISDYGVSETFLIVGIIYFITTFTGARLLKNPPDYHKDIDRVKKGVFTVRTMTKTRNFYLIWISYLLACVGGLLMIGSATELGIELAGLNFKQAALSVALIGVFNAGGRLFWGYISDHIGGKKSAIIMFILSASALLSIGTFTINQTLFYILLSIITFCFGGFLVIYPTITSEYFGIINMGRNYGVVYQAYGIAALFGPILLKSVDGYTTPFIISAVFSLIGGVLITQIRK